MGEMTAIRIGGLPAEAVETLRARAADKGRSLNAYLRELIVEDAALPEPAETMERIASDEPVHYSPEDLREFRDEGRR